MPELPDVEAFRGYFNDTSLNKRVKELEVRSDDILDDVSKEQLISSVEGRRFEQTERLGKHLMVKLEKDKWMAMHFGMTGYFSYFKNTGDIPKHTRILFYFDNGYKLAFVLQRKLGRIALVESKEDLKKGHNLGLDALEIGFEDFKNAVAGTKSSIKSALMKQNKIAGIGNIYSDEILYQCEISPKTKTNNLEVDDLRMLFKKMKEVLNIAIKNDADPHKMPKDYLLPNREKGGTCPKCGSEIETIKVSGRTAYYCPKCQK